LHQSWIGLVGIVFGGISGLVYVIRLALATNKESGNGSSGAPPGSGGAGAPS
jgi:hypothetical protein